MVDQDTIDYVSTAYFEPKKVKTNSNFFHKRDIVQLFSADATMSLKISKKFFAPENMKKTPSKVAHNRPRLFFFSIANRPKSRPNLNSCSIKISHRRTSL